MKDFLAVLFAGVAMLLSLATPSESEQPAKQPTCLCECGPDCRCEDCDCRPEAKQRE